MNNETLKTQVKDYLRHQFGLPADQIDLMMPEFKKTLSQHMNSLILADQQENLTILKEAAHTMKGALLNLGFKGSAQLAQKIENESSAGNREIDYSLLIDTIKKTVLDFVDER